MISFGNLRRTDSVELFSYIQFYPLTRENSPPVILNVKIKKHDEWGLCFALFIPYPCLKRAWTDVNVEALDVAQYTVTIELNDDSRRSVTLTGKGHEWFQAKLDLDVWDVLGRYKVTVSMVDFAGNELDPAYTKEIDGLFGGVLRFLEALWDFLVSLACMIADAVMAALNFLLELIGAAIAGLLGAIFDPLWQGGSNPELTGFADTMELLLDELDETTTGESGSGSRGPPIARSKNGVSGLGFVLENEISDEEEEEEEDSPPYEWAKKVQDGLKGFVFYAVTIGGFMLIPTAIVGVLIDSFLPFGLCALGIFVAVITWFFLSLIPLDTLAEAPTTVEGVRQALEGYHTDHGDAVFLFNMLLLPFALIFGPLILDPIPLTSLAAALGIAMASLLVAAFLAQKQFSSNSALHVAAILLVLWAITLLSVTFTKVLTDPALLPGIKATGLSMLTLFILLNITALASLLGGISKNA
ncbi:MAG: hypothetical protein E3J35_05780 [Methanomassiliicoccales archaeon]|nr:MAG: hypothetical protein E3J35_05780 [Methanomassiliicoccales archaeon]